MKGFIDKNSLLEEVSQERIFELVFGFMPQEDEYVVSPFREDNNPGCWFELDSHGNLRFVDYAAVNHSKKLDCWDAVKMKYKLDNFYEVLLFVKEVLVDNNLETEEKKRKTTFFKKTVRNFFHIFIDKRPFNNSDKKFWSAYGITSKNLEEDDVVALKSYSTYNFYKGDFKKKLYKQLGYSFNFPNSKKKLYFPSSKRRFFTNCNANDIGGIEIKSETLIISKSYKDYRVLKNLGLNTVWVNSETSYPKDAILYLMCQKYKKVIVFYDNDEAGIKGSNNMCARINKFFTNKAIPFNLPEALLAVGVKDPSDMYKKIGKEDFYDYMHKVFIPNAITNNE